MDWASKQNGDLLALAEHQFDVFLTVDRNLSFQQDVNKYNIAVGVMVAKGNRHADLQPLIANVLSVRGAVVPGRVTKAGGPPE